MKKFWKKTYSMYRYNLTKFGTFGWFFDTWLEYFKMQYLIIKMHWDKSFTIIYYLRRTGFLMIPNTCITNFIFIYFYWKVYKFLGFWGTPKFHKMDHIGSKNPQCQNFFLVHYITHCLYRMAIMMGIDTRWQPTCCSHTRGPWSWVQNISAY